jgi:hypothetical protein
MPVGHYPLQDLEIQFETFVVRELLRDTEDIYCSSSILVCSSSRGTLNSHRGVTLRACSSLSSRFEHELHSSVIAQLSHDWVEYDFTALIALIYRL